MKDLFPGYYSPSKEEFSELWQQCIFIFDTNVLLNFYEYHNQTREEYLQVLEAIQERLWIPHQVALEYHRNRIDRIIQAESKFDSAKKLLDKIIEETTKQLLDNFNSQCFPSEAVQQMIEDVKKVFDTFGDKLVSCKEELIKINGTDYIRDKITDLFREKIGESPANQKELDEIYLEGEQRYKIFRPPGFGDDKKNQDKDNNYIHQNLVFKKAYGDLILWKQILKEVKSKSLTHIIFITGDNKPDWWRREHGKTIGPRPELVEEILEAGASLFHMYTPDNFLRYAKDSLQLEIAEKSIQQVKEVSVSNSWSEPELDADFSRQSSDSDHYDLSNIQGLVAASNYAVNNAVSIASIASAASAASAVSMAAKQLSITNIASPASMIAKQLSVIEMTILTEQQRFIKSLNQVVNNENNRLAQMVKQVAIPNMNHLLISSVNKLVDNNNNNARLSENNVQEDNDSSADSNFSEQAESSEDSSF